MTSTPSKIPNVGVDPDQTLRPRPQPPAADSKEHERWCREESIVYEGGSITTAYGNIVQTWSSGDNPLSTQAKEITRASYTATRTNKIGGTSQQVNVPASTYKKYPRKNSGAAASGELFTFVTDDGTFTARVTGDVQNLVEYLSAARVQQYITITVFSNRGAQYGPFAPTTLFN